MATQHVYISNGPITYSPHPPVVTAGDTVIFHVSQRTDTISISWDATSPMTTSGPYSINGSSLTPNDTETVSTTVTEGLYKFTVSPPPPDNWPPKFPEEGSSTHGGLEVSR